MPVRPATVADAAAIGVVHNASREAAYKPQLDAGVFERLPDEVRAERWAKILAEEASATLLAYDDEHAVLGFVTYGASRDAEATETRRSVGEIWSLYVHPAAFRRGIGGALLDAALEALNGGGMDDVTLWVLEANPEAQAFYRRHGFEPDGCRASSGLDKSVPIIRWRRTA